MVEPDAVFAFIRCRPTVIPALPAAMIGPGDKLPDDMWRFHALNY
jgi:hypothetical protein